jgi:hypothetical protein
MPDHVLMDLAIVILDLRVLIVRLKFAPMVVLVMDTAQMIILLALVTLVGLDLIVL